jgi:hypothetical protein
MVGGFLELEMDRAVLGENRVSSLTCYSLHTLNVKKDFYSFICLLFTVKSQDRPRIDLELYDCIGVR